MPLDRLPARPSATATAEHALRTAIVTGELAPGERLPPERELAARFGISRLTLRAALATLAAAGLVSVRHGSGYTVRDVRASGGTDLLPQLLALAASDKTLRAAAADLLRLRRHLAGAVLEAIAERPPAGPARRAVAAAVERFAQAVEAGEIAAIANADLGVVAALVDTTGSLILRVCLNPIVGVLRESDPLRAALYGNPHTNLVGWRALAAWLERPQADMIPTLLAGLAAHDRASIDRLRGGRTR